MWHFDQILQFALPTNWVFCAKRSCLSWRTSSFASILCYLHYASSFLLLDLPSGCEITAPPKAWHRYFLVTLCACWYLLVTASYNLFFFFSKCFSHDTQIKKNAETGKKTIKTFSHFVVAAVDPRSLSSTLKTLPVLLAPWRRVLDGDFLHLTFCLASYFPSSNPSQPHTCSLLVSHSTFFTLSPPHTPSLTRYLSADLLSPSRWAFALCLHFFHRELRDETFWSGRKVGRGDNLPRILLFRDIIKAKMI